MRISKVFFQACNNCMKKLYTLLSHPVLSNLLCKDSVSSSRVRLGSLTSPANFMGQPSWVSARDIKILLNHNIFFLHLITLMKSILLLFAYLGNFLSLSWKNCFKTLIDLVLFFCLSDKCYHTHTKFKQKHPTTEPFPVEVGLRGSPPTQVCQFFVQLGGNGRGCHL